MNYIVFDLEWNQPPTEEALVTKPVYLTGEIVQIGAVKLDDTFAVVDELRLYIKPIYYPKMHRRIAALTGIHDSVLERSGKPFPEAFAEFARWCGEEYTYLTWSGTDLPMLVDNMILHGLDVSVLPDTCDVQRIFSREIMRCDRKISLNDALKILNEQGDAAHDALHDARNTVKVCAHLDLESYIGEYITAVYGEAPMDRCFDSVGAILADEAVATVNCPWCGETLKCQGWVSRESGEFLALGVCPQEDECILQIRCIRRKSGDYQVSRMIFEISDDLWEQYQDRLEAQNQPVGNS